MVRRVVAVVVVVGMLLALVPVGGVAAETPEATVSEIPATGVDATVTDRLRAGTTLSGVSRADTDGVLEQPTRAAVYSAIDDTPGANLDELAGAVGVSKSTVRYHVDVLSEAGLVETATLAGTLRVSTPEVDTERAGALRADSTGPLLDAIGAREPASVTTIADATDRAPSTVSHHLAALEKRGLVERERDGESVLTSLSPETKAALVELR